MYYYDSYLLRHQSARPFSFNDDAEVEAALQLLGLTAFYIACKSEGCRCSLDQLAKLSCGRFSEQEIVDMEIKILTTLQWLLNPPLPQDFSYLYITQLSKYAKSSSDFANVLLEVSNYIIELIVHCDSLKYERPSVIACAAIMVSFHGLKSSIMESQEEVKQCFLKMVTESCLNDTSLVDKIQSVENQMKSILTRKYANNFKNIFLDFDPNGLVYDSCDDPPSLL